MMIAWANQAELPLHLLLTKADKLKRGAAQNTLLGVRRELGEQASVQLFSAVKKQGLIDARRQLSEWLELESETNEAVETS